MATFFWASNIAIGRALRGQIGPITLTVFRFSIAGLIFAILVHKFRPDRRQIRSNWKNLLAMGLTGVFAFPSILYLALQRTSATNAALINALGPLTTALLAAIVLRETLWFAIPLLLSAAYFEWLASPPKLESHIFLAGIYIAVFPTCIAFLSWNEGIRRVGPARSMAFYNMLPVYGALLGIIFLGETLDWTQIVGGSMVIMGALLATRT